MATWDTLPIFIALPLAVAAACMSGSGDARQQISAYLMEVIEPHVTDLGGDAADPFGMDGGVAWPLPARMDVVSSR